MDKRVNYYLLVLLLGVLDVPVTMAECQHPPEIDGAKHNLAVSPPFPEATVASYHCLIGYRDSGTSRTFTCNQTVWTGGNLQCHEILCDFIGPPQNGKIINSPTYKINTIIEFGCRPGYTLNGVPSRRCAIDGWTRSTPSCDVVMCDEFEGVAHGHIFQEAPDGIHNDYGSQITVTSCDENYQLSGPSRITCGADGQWSQSPTCEVSSCPPYKLSTSPCTKEYLTYGTMYYLQCVEETANVSATRVGPASAVCTDNNWSDLDMACYCNCKVRADTDSVRLQNVDNNGFLSHAEVLVWSCRNGGTKATSEDLVCNDGVMEQPMCIIPITTTTTTTATTSSTTTFTSTTTTSGTNPTSTDSTSMSGTYPTSTPIVALVVNITDLLNESTTQPVFPESSISDTYPTSSTSSAAAVLNVTDVLNVSSTKPPHPEKSESRTSLTPTSDTAIMSKVTGLPTASTTQPQFPEIAVCSCRCNVTQDSGIVEKYKLYKKNNSSLETDLKCVISVQDGGYNCSLHNFGVVLCRSQGKEISDATSDAQISVEEFCKCHSKTKSCPNGTIPCHKENASFTCLFLLIFSFISMLML